MQTIKEIFLAIALILLVAGVYGYNHVRSGQERDKQSQYLHQEKINTQITQLDKLLDGKINVRSLSPDITDDNLQGQFEEYQMKELTSRSDIMTLSIVSISIAVTILAVWLLGTIVYGIRQALKWLKKFFIIFWQYAKKSRLKEFSIICFHRIKTTIKSLRARIFKKNYFSKYKLHNVYLKKENKKIETLFTNDTSVNQQQNAAPELNSKLLDQLEQNIRNTILTDYHKHAVTVQNSIKQQSQTIEKQVTEVLQMAQSIKETSEKNVTPVKDTLDELANQISAIREYASTQQERIEKLQQGYDWNIIKNFCLRVIRCIDNLEARIEKLSERQMDTTDLTEIMDEMLFALESSGIEQYRPEVNSEYGGQEKNIEIIKDKDSTSPDKKGKIAEVIKPGYQYLIEDGNIKIVRPARVKLYA